jgi:hypothetical protein
MADNKTGFWSGVLKIPSSKGLVGNQSKDEKGRFASSGVKETPPAGIHEISSNIPGKDDRDFFKQNFSHNGRTKEGHTILMRNTEHGPMPHVVSSQENYTEAGFPATRLKFSVPEGGESHHSDKYSSRSAVKARSGSTGEKRIHSPVKGPQAKARVERAWTQFKEKYPDAHAALSHYKGENKVVPTEKPT